MRLRRFEQFAAHPDPLTPAVYWVNQYAVSPDQAGGTRHFDMAAELILQGLAVTVVASDLSLSTRRYSRRLRSWDPRPLPERIGPVPFVWLPAGSYSRNDWRRFASMVIFGVGAALYLLRVPRRGRPTVFVGSSPHLAAALGTWFAAWLRRIPFVLEIRDLWPESYTEVTGAESGAVVGVMRWIADFLYRRADAIVVLADPNRDRISERGADPDKIHCVPNGVDLSAFSPMLAAHPKRDRLRFLYAGAHGPANGLDVVVHACHELQSAGRDDLEVVLVGDGPTKPELVLMAASLGLTNLSFWEPVPKRAMPELLRSADVGLMILAPAELFGYGVSPNKLFDYLAADLPILTNVPGLVADIVEAAGAGRTCAAGDPRALASTMIAMAEAPAGLNRYRTGRAFVTQHYDRRVLAHRFKEILVSVSSSLTAGE